jgi:hypothetical protein
MPYILFAVFDRLKIKERTIFMYAILLAKSGEFRRVGLCRLTYGKNVNKGLFSLSIADDFSLKKAALLGRPRPFTRPIAAGNAQTILAF